MISLATRGYLYPRVITQIFLGDGPTITETKENVPGIQGATSAQPEGPSISGSVVPGPSISGGSSSQTTTVEPPSISGSGVPKITGGK